MKKIIINKILRIGFLQPVWEKLHSLSIVAMNFWGGAKFEDSGELWVIEHVIKKNNLQPIIFDVGANKGFYALALQKILGDKAEIYCFEPSESTYKELQKNIEKIPNIKFFNFGFSDKQEQLTLHSTNESNGLSSIYENNPLTTFNHKETITLNTLNDFCNSNQIKEIDFLKIDVEGHEYKVLLGALNLLKSNKIKIIQFEIGECNIASKTFFRDFFELLKDQYRIFRVLPGGLREVKAYNTIQEVFVCVNYIAINKMAKNYL
jgi:FkbM family methyltransferase